MKVAFVAFGSMNLPWVNQGNAMEILTYELARNLARSNEVIVYAQKKRGQKDSLYDQGVLYKRLSTTLDKWYPYLSTSISNILPGLSKAKAKKPFFSSILYYLIYALRVAKDIGKQNCDIVHLHNLSQFAPIFRAINPDIKIVLHMHAEWLTQLDRDMIENHLKHVDLILCCSDYITEKTITKFPRYSDMCKTLHNGVDINKFVTETSDSRKNKDTTRLLYVGRYSPEKGVHVLLDALKIVSEHHSHVKLEIIGPIGSAPVLRGRELILYLTDDPKVLQLSPYYKKNYVSLSQRKLSSDVKQRISYSGYVNRKTLIQRYQEADVFVFPAVWQEPFGMPIVEAMATGTPVISTRVGGIKEIVEEDQTGILVEPGNHIELAKAILKLVKDKEMRVSMGVSSRKRASKKFSWGHLSNILSKHYESII